MRNVVILFGAACALLLAGCGGSDDTASRADSSSAGSAGSSTSAPDTSTANASGASTSGTGSASSAQLEDALLPASEVGSGFERTVSDTGDKDPLPCTPNDRPLRDQVPSKEYLGGTYRSQSVQVTENLFRFADEAAAQRFVSVSKAGLGCDSVEIDNESYRLDGPADLPVDGTDTDDALRWDLVGKQYVSSLCLTRLGDVIVAFTFVATPDTANTLDVPSTVSKAVARVDDKL